LCLVSSRVPSGSRSWQSSPSTLLRVPPMEVERFKHRQLAPTVGPSSRSSGEFEGPHQQVNCYDGVETQRTRREWTTSCPPSTVHMHADLDGEFMPMTSEAYNTPCFPDKKRRCHQSPRPINTMRHQSKSDTEKQFTHKTKASWLASLKRNFIIFVLQAHQRLPGSYSVLV
jgi:hypothetical protein